MRYIDKQHTDTFIFESVKDMMDYTLPSAFEQRDSHFVGARIESWNKLQERINQPWAEGMYIFEQFVRSLESIDIPELRSHKRRTSFDEAEGDEIDYDRLRSGQAYWRQASREVSTGPQEVTIITDASANCFIESEDILWRGAVALALTKKLEELGYKVELWITDGTNELYDDARHKYVHVSCCLKRPEDPLDVSTLINTMSGWFYRTEIFTLLTTICKKNKHLVSPCLGRAKPPTEEDLDELSRDELRIYSSGVFSMASAMSMMQAELDKVRAVS